ncbi:alkaline phosphatase [Roseateles sp. DAIF2]|uniref:alkaline phosphatase D family protein n=1 Tax=Roseateles sp. DAIF2 TaxID=2714952 RepID=UPI0018A30685|nr:alkaline phosphatase D family protein [Roseateles sp. DAIF2]QPF72032.1 alkaline phosphatase [Roseateles sp. DAIF2]
MLRDTPHLPPLASIPRRGLLQAALLAGCAPGLLLRHADAADAPLFPLGVASGSPTAESLVLWTRLVGAALPAEVPVAWELAEDEQFRSIVARGSERAIAADAHSVHAEPAGLKPGRWYWYRFSALGQRSPVGRTRSAPAATETTTRLRFAIASCQRWDHGEYAAWRDMAAQELDLVLFLGDYIYETMTPADSRARRRHEGGLCRTLDDYRRRYAQYKSDPQLQAMHARAPWIAIWDDHEVDNDWAGAQSQTLDPATEFLQRRAAAAQAYWEHLPFPKSARPRGPQMRLYGSHDWGGLARIITLDDRQWRDPQACPRPGRGGSNTVDLKDCETLLEPRRTLLGAAQEDWLRDRWDKTRPWNLLAQQTLMARLNWQDPAEGPGRHWTDGWDGYPAARQRLLGGMLAAGARNPVVLGGDVHAHYVADLKLDYADAKAPVVASEFCGTSISSHGMAQERIDKVLPFNPHIRLGRSDRRGYMRFELSAERLEAELRGVDDPWSAASPVASLAKFVVEAGRPGAQPA